MRGSRDTRVKIPARVFDELARTLQREGVGYLVSGSVIEPDQISFERGADPEIVRVQNSGQAKVAS